MSDSQKKIQLFLDDQKECLAELTTPVTFELNTEALEDGPHTLKIVSMVAPSKNHGVKIIPFTVRNGPAIDIEGLSPNGVVGGKIPLLINTYNKGDKVFAIDGSETPKSIPSWLWIVVICFFAWAAYYGFTSLFLMDI